MLPYILEQPLIECYYGLCGENGRTLCNGGNPLGVNRKRKKKFQSDSDGKTNANQMSSTKTQFDTLFKKMYIFYWRKSLEEPPEKRVPISNLREPSMYSILFIKTHKLINSSVSLTNTVSANIFTKFSSISFLKVRSF